MPLIQVCEVRRDKRRCNRKASRWMRIKYEGYNGVPIHKVIAACPACLTDMPYAVEQDMGPILVSMKGSKA